MLKEINREFLRKLEATVTGEEFPGMMTIAVIVFLILLLASKLGYGPTRE